MLLQNICFSTGKVYSGSKLEKTWPDYAISSAVVFAKLPHTLHNSEETMKQNK